MKILVVEDEPKSAAFLRKGLSASGFVVDLAADGDEALSLAANLSYDLVILDVMLPRRNGWTVISDLRSRGIRTPVLASIRLTCGELNVVYTALANRRHALMVM